MRKLNVIIATDSFKESISSYEAGNIIKEAIEKVCEAEVTVFPIADGGEGTVQALTQALNGIIKISEVMGPLGNTVKAQW